MNGTLHHVEIYVSDLNKTIAFWKWLLTEKFSYVISQKWDFGISFLLGDTYLVFVQTEEKYLKQSAIDCFKFFEKFRDNKLHALKKFIGKTQGS